MTNQEPTIIGICHFCKECGEMAGWYHESEESQPKTICYTCCCAFAGYDVDADN